MGFCKTKVKIKKENSTFLGYHLELWRSSFLKHVEKIKLCRRTVKLPGKHLLATFVPKFCSKNPIFSWNWKVSFLLTLRDSTYLFSCWIGLTFPPISIENEAILMTLCMAFGVCLRPHSRFFTTTRPLLYIFSCCEEEVKTRFFPFFSKKGHCWPTLWLLSLLHPLDF